MKSSIVRIVLASVAFISIAAPTFASAQTLTANPTTGKAPLTVTFDLGVLPANNYKVRFGDGSKPAIPSPVACTRSIPASCSYQVVHTYTKKGVYTAKLVLNGVKLAKTKITVTQ